LPFVIHVHASVIVPFIKRRKNRRYAEHHSDMAALASDLLVPARQLTCAGRVDALVALAVCPLLSSRSAAIASSSFPVAQRRDAKAPSGPPPSTLGRTVTSMSFSRNAASYFPRPWLRSKRATERGAQGRGHLLQNWPRRPAEPNRARETRRATLAPLEPKCTQGPLSRDTCWGPTKPVAAA
jgi:hypothetical protein